MKHIITALACMLFAHGAWAKDYAIDYENSMVTFSGEHAGNVFDGAFIGWSAEISFDPAKLDASRFTASFDVSTATTGNSMYDGTLPTKDWFNVKEHPKASFTSSSFALTEDGTYKVIGDLTIRGITKPVTMVFAIKDLDANPVIATGALTIDRLAYDIGKSSDGAAEWVSREIPVKLSITATPNN
ncbi:MAG: YceI family protein [Rickettsiales bacterium]|nr:YceI family protein [Rickettsiales bacterium]